MFDDLREAARGIIDIADGYAIGGMSVSDRTVGACWRIGSRLPAGHRAI
jgi:hypothetical protein